MHNEKNERPGATCKHMYKHKQIYKYKVFTNVNATSHQGTKIIIQIEPHAMR